MHREGEITSSFLYFFSRILVSCKSFQPLSYYLPNYDGNTNKVIFLFEKNVILSGKLQINKRVYSLINCSVRKLDKEKGYFVHVCVSFRRQLYEVQ